MNQRSNQDNFKVASCCASIGPSDASRDPSVEAVHQQVRDAYASVADAGAPQGTSSQVAARLGYNVGDIEKHGAANLGLGCGNPVGLATLKPGDHVLDLGSGAGFDALIARSHVGRSGRVIGVDMTPEMVKKAQQNAVKQGVAENVEFHQGMIESLPIESATIDVVLSNCVINLSPDKGRVYREAYRVLKPGGKLVFSDILLTQPLPDVIVASSEALAGCIAGAALVDETERMISAAGFVNIKIERKAGGESFEAYQDPIAETVRAALAPDVLSRALASVGSYTIEAVKT